MCELSSGLMSLTTSGLRVTQVRWAGYGADHDTWVSKKIVTVRALARRRLSCSHPSALVGCQRHGPVHVWIPHSTQCSDRSRSSQLQEEAEELLTARWTAKNVEPEVMAGLQPLAGPEVIWQAPARHSAGHSTRTPLFKLERSL